MSQRHPRLTQIKVLATTDLHGHLLPYDYIRDRPMQGGGLAGLARLIAEERAQAAEAGIPTLLLDNGDTFQGTPLAAYLATQEVTPDHPIVASMNQLGYDAIGLGNHDLDHGLPYLKAVAAQMNMPLLSSNLRGIDISPMRQTLLLPVLSGNQSAGQAPLTLGLISVLPRQSAAWHRHHLGDALDVEEPANAVSGAAASLKAAGADLIVVLAHMGAGLSRGGNSDIEAAQALAMTGEIDALILGHTHRRLPSVDYATREGVDVSTSTLGEVPALMAGHGGSDLGVMDLDLRHDPNTGWQITTHRCVLRPNGANVLADKTITALAQPVHAAVRVKLGEVVGTTPRPLHSFFSIVSPTPTQHLTALTHYCTVRDALQQTEHAELPLLATAAAHGAGGRDGVANFINIPEGDVLRRHIAGLNPFANYAVGIAITGAGLRSWLEHAALLFNTLTHSAPEQMLTNPNVPAFQFDTIFGLHYKIDPTAQPCARILDLQYNGARLRDTDPFILATNQFRASGGGGYLPTPESRIVTRSNLPVERRMMDMISQPPQAQWSDSAPWSFAPDLAVKAIIDTHPDAMERLKDIRHLRPRLKGSTSEGFIRLSITL
jgi:2',3'-cyclic-nucleotide 2'-phosphodiesterase/3'-nucleotidase